MQVFWSRATQARSSCSCRSCLHTATNFARHTNTAVGKSRVRVSDVITACYSTILATAAVADMKVKDERRRNWDRVIAEAKASTPTDESSSPPPEIAGATDSNCSTISNSNQQTTLSAFRQIAAYNSPNEPPSSLWTKLLKAGSKSEDKPPFVREEPDPYLPSREPLREKHTVKMQGMIARLAYKFLTRSKIFSKRGPLSGHLELETLKMVDMLQSLLEGFNTVPLYVWNNIDDVKSEREALHQALHIICWNTAANDRASTNLMLAKISYNLLVSTTPPNIETYNVMLAEFLRLRLPHFAQMVVNSFMWDSKLKPNQDTTRLLLDHYRARENRGGFRSIIKRMRGVQRPRYSRSYDMRIKMRYLRDLYKPSVRKWVLNSKTAYRDGVLHEKAPRTTAIFNSLILGGLELQGLSTAVRQIRAAFREGHQVYQDTLCSVIRACLEQADFGRSWRLLLTLLDHWEHGVGRLVTVYSIDLRQLIYQLFEMCGFETSLNSKTAPPEGVSWHAVQALLHFMHIESLNDTLERCADFTMSLSRSLGLTHSESQAPLGINQTPDIDLAMQIVEDYATKQRFLIDRQRELVISTRWFRLEALEGLLDTRWHHILDIEDQLRSLVHVRLWRDRPQVDGGAVPQNATLSPNRACLEKHCLPSKPDSPRKLAWKKVRVDVEKFLPLISSKEDYIRLRQASPRPADTAYFRRMKRRYPKWIDPLQAPFPVSV